MRALLMCNGQSTIEVLGNSHEYEAWGGPWENRNESQSQESTVAEGGQAWVRREATGVQLSPPNGIGH